MKKIIINESDKKIIHDFLKSQEIPFFLLKALKMNKTSLGKHPSFPPDDDYCFDEKITRKRFDEVKEGLKNVEELTDYSENSVPTILNKLIKECQEKEKPIRKNLERICFNTINKMFNIPSDLIVYSCNLTDSVSKRKYKLRLTPESVDNIEFEDIVEMENISDEVYKRRLIDALVMGASMDYTNLCRKFYLSDIFDLNSKLPELYSKIINLNNYLTFIKSESNITDKTPMQGGVVNVILGNENTKSKIDVEAIIFPILLSESIKGFMELFASHGLPEKRDMALYVVKKSDFLMAEPWDMRLGPILWQYLLDSFDSELDTKMIPNIINIIVKLPCEEFFKLMREIFGKTKKSKKVMKLISDKVKHDIELSDFNDDLDKKREYYNGNNKYITLNELENEMLYNE